MRKIVVLIITFFGFLIPRASFLQKNIFEALLLNNTSFVKNYLENEGGIDLVKIDKVLISTDKRKKVAKEISLYDY